MKVLILHQHYKSPATGGAIRSYYLAKALVDKGHQAIVLTGHSGAGVLKTKEEGIEIHHLPIPYDNRFQFYARGWSFFKYIVAAIWHTRNWKDIDLTYAISVPITISWVARWLRWTKRIPYVFEVGDLWPDAPVEMGFVENFFLRKMLYTMEHAAYVNARSIVALSPAIQANIQKKVPGKQVDMIPNMADCEFYRPTNKNASLEQKWGVEGKFVVSYIGAMGVANGLDYFLECANATRKAKLPVHFFLCGDGALLERLKHNAVQLGLIQSFESGKGDWLTFVPFTNREGVRDLMKVTDAMFVCYKPVPILETGSPNKYFDGLAAGKLIIVNFGGWIRQDIETASCGFYANPQQPTDFVEKLSGYIDDHDYFSKAQEAARTLAEQKYDRTKLTAKWVTVLESGATGIKQKSED